MAEEGTQAVKQWNWERAREFVYPLIVVGLVGILFLVIAAGGNDIGSSSYLGESKLGPAKLEPIGETGLNRVILTEKAAERLDIQTAAVQEQEIDGQMRLVVPYSAVIYGLHGETWAYVNSDVLTYHRDPIVVDYIEGDTAILTSGPAIGTEVVTVGVAELFGTDTGVGK